MPHVYLQTMILKDQVILSDAACSQGHHHRGDSFS